MSKLVKWGVVLLVSPAFPILVGSVGGLLVNSPRIYSFASFAAEFCLLTMTPLGALFILVGALRALARRSRPKSKAPS